MPTPTPQSVIARFSTLTGIALRVISHNMESQAIDFVRAGFTLEELEQVIRWTQQQVQQGKNGFSHLSLQFHVIFGKYGSGGEFETFQTRLAMAQKTVRTRPLPKEHSVTRNVGNGDTVTVIDFPAPEAAVPVAGPEVARQLAALRASLGGAA